MTAGINKSTILQNTLLLKLNKSREIYLRFSEMSLVQRIFMHAKSSLLSNFYFARALQNNRKYRRYFTSAFLR